MNIEPDAIETYQSTTTLLLAFKLAEKRYPLRKPTNHKALIWNKGQELRIGKAIQHSANNWPGKQKTQCYMRHSTVLLKRKTQQK